MKKLSNKILLLIVLCMGIGFSYLTSGLTIRGNTEVSGNSWDIYFENIQVLSGSVSSPLPSIDTNKTKVNFAIELEKPGDYYAFTVNAVNNGTIDAMVDTIIKNNYDESTSKLFDYTVTYLDGREIEKNDFLGAKTTTTYKVLIQYKKDISPSDLSSTDIDLNLSFEVNYIQAIEDVNKIVYGQFWEYDYTNSEQIFTIPSDGNYKLEVWGAQGGYSTVNSGNTKQSPGYGGYSKGNISLLKGDVLYINVGGQGKDGSVYGCSTGTAIGGYNGGGNSSSWCAGGSGGGATHIATSTGLLSSLSSNKDSIIIVAGGAGGASHLEPGRTESFADGSGGGYIGNNGISGFTDRAAGKGATQSSGGTGGNSGTFGKGGNAIDNYAGGGGGGYYGGGSAVYRSAPGGGGSGYIGNSSLTNKVMYCYKCLETSDETIKTISTMNVSSTAISNNAKKGNGYARIINNPDAYILFGNLNKNANLNNIDFDIKTGAISFETTLTNTNNNTEFTFEIVNSSDKDYYISKILKSNFDSSKIEYKVTYDDEAEVEKNNIIRANHKEKIIVKIKLLDESFELNNEKFTLTINLNEINRKALYTGKNWNIGYEGKEYEFIVPMDGNYKIEVWGAQGGYGLSNDCSGGYGGYSVGSIELNKNQILYINVGGKGTDTISMTSSLINGGYNGGGSTHAYTDKYSGSGGGATHISFISGSLSSLSSHSKDDKILIVAGGGGAGSYQPGYYSATGGSGGGYQGNIGTTTATSSNRLGFGGTQTSGGLGQDDLGTNNGSFGQGANVTTSADGTGGGGGYYGGGAGKWASGSGGGSGYIGNSLLNNKAMYCYNCQEPDTNDENYSNIKTISTSNVSETPTSQYAKIGNGYAKLTYLGE